MMKKMIWFIIITVAVAIVVSVGVNIGAIWDAIKAVPKDRIVAYLLGAFSMFLAQFLAGRTKSSSEE